MNLGEYPVLFNSIIFKQKIRLSEAVRVWLCSVSHISLCKHILQLLCTRWKLIWYKVVFKLIIFEITKKKKTKFSLTFPQLIHHYATRHWSVSSSIYPIYGSMKLTETALNVYRPLRCSYRPSGDWINGINFEQRRKVGIAFWRKPDAIFNNNNNGK